VHIRNSPTNMSVSATDMQNGLVNGFPVLIKFE